MVEKVTFLIFAFKGKPKTMKILRSLCTVTCLLAFGYMNAQNTDGFSYFSYESKGIKPLNERVKLGEFTAIDCAVFSVQKDTLYNHQIHQAEFFGLVNKSGSIVLNPTHDLIEPLRTNPEFFIVEKGGLKGLVNASGAYLIPPKCKEITEMMGDTPVLKLTFVSGDCAISDLDGNYLTETYQAIEPLDYGGYVVSKGAYQGVLDSDFSQRIKTAYKSIVQCDSLHMLLEDKYAMWTIVDDRGKPLIKEAFSKVDPVDFQDELYGFIVEKNEKYRFLSASFQEVLKPSFAQIHVLKFEDNAPLLYRNTRNRSRIFDAKGKVIYRKKFSSVEENVFSQDMYFVRNYRKIDWKKDPFGSSKKTKIEVYTLLNRKGKKVGKLDFNEVVFYEDLQRCVAHNPNIYYLLDSTLRPMHHDSYTYMTKAKDDQFIVQRGGYVTEQVNITYGGVYGVVDKNLHTIIPIEYEEVSLLNPSKGVYMVKKQGDYGLINKLGQVIVPVEFEEIIMDESQEFAFVAKKDFSRKVLWGLVRLVDGERLIPVDNTQLYSTSVDSFFIFSKDFRQFGLMNHRGQVLKAPTSAFFEVLSLGDSLFLETTINTEIDEISFGGRVHSLGSRGGVKGLESLNGTTILPISYESMELFRKNLAIVTDHRGQQSIMDLKGNIVFSDSMVTYLKGIGSSNRDSLFLDGVNLQFDARGNRISGEFGLLNHRGQRLIPRNFSSLKNQGNFLVGFRKSTNWFTLFDLSGKVVMDSLESYCFLSDSILVYRKEDVVSIVNVNSKHLVSGIQWVDFRLISGGNFNGIVALKNKSNQWGVMNELGEILIKPQYDDIKINEGNYLVVGKLERGSLVYNYGVVNLKNEVLIPLEYYKIDFSPVPGLFHCFTRKKHFVLNSSDEIVHLRGKNQFLN